MNGVRHFMAEGSGQLLGILHEIEQRIHDINVTAWSGEGIRLALVDEVEFERMGVTRLSHPRDRVKNAGRRAATDHCDQVGATAMRAAYRTSTVPPMQLR